MQEGGQMPTFRRMPKRGFSNAPFRTEYLVVNVARLEERFEAGAHVTPESLREKGLIRKAGVPVKVLGDGEIKKKLLVEVAKVSESARRKIEAAGGEVRLTV
jgi:large subunit ribosomal protein L15